MTKEDVKTIAITSAIAAAAGAVASAGVTYLIQRLMEKKKATTAQPTWVLTPVPQPFPFAPAPLPLPPPSTAGFGVAELGPYRAL